MFYYIGRIVVLEYLCERDRIGEWEDWSVQIGRNRNENEKILHFHKLSYMTDKF